jgi:hypothetical protein
MVNARTLLGIAILTGLVACQRSPNDAKIIGTWQYNTRNGRLWRYTFASDHTFVLYIDQDDADGKETAAFRRFSAGTWRFDGDVLMDTIEDRGAGIPRTTTRTRILEFRKDRLIIADSTEAFVRVP